MKTKTGGQILVATLALHGVPRISCVAGESYLPVLDALYQHPTIQTITCRHEGEAAFMAESWGKLTGEAGVCMVTRGPGATNAAIGVHTAMQDSTPLVLFVGQVSRADKGRESFQEFDTASAFTPWAKEAFDIVHVEDIAGAVTHALYIAQSGRNGPVVVGLPEDILSEVCHFQEMTNPPPVFPLAHGKEFADIITLLKSAKNPLIIAGGHGWHDETCSALERFTRHTHIPILAAWRRHDLLSSRNPYFGGELGMGANPALVKAIQNECDLLLVIGARLDECTVQGYSLLDIPTPRQTLIHLYPSTQEMGKVYTPTLGISCEINCTVEHLSSLACKTEWPEWQAWGQRINVLYQNWTALPAPQPWDGADMNTIVSHLNAVLPDDAIITSDAGNFSIWLRRFLKHGRPARMLAPTSGAMGYGAPSACASALIHPKRTVLGFSGDGGFMMTGVHALATALQHNAKPVFIVCNNGLYGTIRMHQDRTFPDRPHATHLRNPDFSALAESYGALGLKVRSAKAFPSALEGAMKADRASVIEVMMDPRQLTPASTV